MIRRRGILAAMEPTPGRPSEVVLIRHGQTEWSRTGRHTGRTDVELTEAGREQAVRLVDRLRGRRFARVLTSPLGRARETCRIAGLADDAVESADLLEWDYGEYEGRTTADIRTEIAGWSIWDGEVPGGESPDEVGERADRVIASLGPLGGDAAIFAHGHILRVLTARWLGLPARDGRLFALDTATFSVLGWERENRVVRSWNVSANP